MNIIVGEQAASEVNGKYLILELDSFKVPEKSDPVKTYCLIEEISLDSIHGLEQMQDLHKNLIKNYRLKNWNFCLNALEHLKGQWNRELDSFYDILEDRIKEYQKQDPGPTWDGVIKQ